MWISFTGDRARARGHPFKTQEAMTSFPTPGHLSHTVHTQWLSVLSHKAEEFSTWPLSDSVQKRKTRARSLYGFLPLFTHSCSPCACTQVMLFELLGQSRRHETRNSENTSDVFPSLSHTLRLHPNDPCRFHLGHGFRIKMEAPVLFRNTRHPTCWV